MTNLRMEAAPNPTLEEEEQLKERLGAWNMEVTGHRDYAPVNFFLRDESGAIRGGALGDTRLMEAAHAAGRDKGAQRRSLAPSAGRRGPSTKG